MIGAPGKPMIRVPAIVSCAQCGKRFERHLDPRHAKTYCSNKCKHLGSVGKGKPWPNAKGRKETAVACPQCGNEFKRRPDQIAKYARNCCSRACSNLAKKGHGTARNRSEYPCETCGNIVTRTPATIRARVFCSRACASVTQWASQEAHPMWKGGSSPYPPNYTKALRAKIRKRDGQRCRHCLNPGSRDNRLEIHHRDEDKQNNRESNLVTLCRKCHNAVHRGTLTLSV